MGGVGDGSMSSPPEIEYLPATGNDDGSMSVDLSSLSGSENPDTVSASVNCVARHYRSKNKELRVKVPREYFSFIDPLCQVGFNRIEYAKSTYIVLGEDKSCTILCANEIASDIKLMQRGNIASSSNQTVDHAISTVQTPSQIPCEQGSEFQQSSQAFPLGPFGMGNDNEAAGLQGLSTGSEFPERGVQTKKRPHLANESERPSTRFRGPDFEDKEKGLVLQFKLEYLQDPANEGKSHKWLTPVTDKMKDSGYNRDPAAWRGLCDTLKKNCNALRTRTPQDTSYWDLKMDQKKVIKKKDRHFPLTFERKWYDAMENIEKIEPRSVAKKETQRDGQGGVFSQSLTSAITCSANFVGAGSLDANIQASLHHPRHVSTQGSDAELQRHRAPLSCIQDFASSSHSLRKNDYQELSFTMEEQLVVQRELEHELTASALSMPMDYSSLDSLGLFDFDGCSK